MTEQEAFNIVVRHLGAQGSKSLMADMYTCAYRGTDGRKCAVGVLIPDAVYKPRFEGANWVTLCGETSLKALELPKYLLVEMQKVHDNYPVGSWHDELRAVANIFNLDTHALDEAFADYR